MADSAQFIAQDAAAVSLGGYPALCQDVGHSVRHAAAVVIGPLLKRWKRRATPLHRGDLWHSAHPKLSQCRISGQGGDVNTLSKSTAEANSRTSTENW